MACRQTGDKPLSEPMMAYFTDAYVRHSTSLSYDSISVFDCQANIGTASVHKTQRWGNASLTVY